MSTKPSTGRVRATYGFIRGHRNEHSVQMMCRVLGVAPSGYYSFARAVRRASGLADFHPHRCRHTYALRFVGDGGSLAVLQQLLGHADVKTTMRYAKLSQDVIEREARRVFKEREGA